jgi:hypothetical protein
MTNPTNGNQPAMPQVPWAKQASVKTEQTTDRKRRVVESLPDWEPLPPGEILVHRPRHDS